MTRAAQVCAISGCPHLLPCPDHPARRSWHGSTRRRTLPPDWARRRSAVLDRDPICRCDGCPLCRPPDAGRCDRPSTQADHIDGRLDHNLTNLRGICDPCHVHRSSSQGGRARAAAHGRAD